jgi:D-amino-acid dehydrogenase
VTGFRSEGRRLVAAQAGNQQLDADAFVLAAGSYTPGLARQLGIRVPVKPVKGYSITVPRGDWPDGPRIPVADDGLHAAVVPIGDQIRVAGTAEFTGLDVTIGRRRIENLENLLRMIYPGFADRLTDADKQPWCGLRPMSADGVPVIGSTSRPNVFVNTGHGHLGWTMAAGSGKALADHIVGEQPEIDLSDYHISRF